MKQVTLNIPDGKFDFFMEVFQKLGLNVSDQSYNIPSWQQEITLKRLEEIEKDPSEGIDFKEMLNALEKSMAYKLISSSKAEKDIDKAIAYYKEIRIELAREFLLELKATIHYIEKHSRKIQVRYHNIRVAFLKRFPYGIHFTLNDKTVFILSVFNMAEDPEKWKESLE